MGEESDQQNQELYNSLYIGQIVDRLDPLGLGRVRVRIPGLFEPPNLSPWALPLGGNGGGHAQRGDFHPPEKDAFVGILFYLGSLESPFYIGAHWAKGEVPTGGVITKGDEGLYVKETKFWKIETDERAPAEIIRITNKATGDKIEFDGTGRKIVAVVDDAVLTLDATLDKASIKTGTVEVELDKGSDTATIKAGTIELGAAAIESLVKGDAFKTFLDVFLLTTFNGHLHPTAATGPPSPPTLLATAMPASTLSTKSKTE